MEPTWCWLPALVVSYSLTPVTQIFFLLHESVKPIPSWAPFLFILNSLLCQPQTVSTLISFLQIRCCMRTHMCFVLCVCECVCVCSYPPWPISFSFLFFNSPTLHTYSLQPLELSVFSWLCGSWAHSLPSPACLFSVLCSALQVSHANPTYDCNQWLSPLPF